MRAELVHATLPAARIREATNQHNCSVKSLDMKSNGRRSGQPLDLKWQWVTRYFRYHTEPAREKRAAIACYFKVLTTNRTSLCMTTPGMVGDGKIKLSGGIDLAYYSRALFLREEGRGDTAE